MKIHLATNISSLDSAIENSKKDAEFVYEKINKTGTDTKIEFTGRSTYREAVLAHVDIEKPDILIFYENLKGNIDIIDLFRAIRIQSPDTRIIFLADAKREVGSAFLAAVVNMGIYDVIVKDAISVGQIFDKVLVPTKYADVIHYLPKVTIDEKTNTAIFKAPDVNEMSDSKKVLNILSKKKTVAETLNEREKENYSIVDSVINNTGNEDIKDRTSDEMQYKYRKNEPVIEKIEEQTPRDVEKVKNIEEEVKVNEPRLLDILTDSKKPVDKEDGELEIDEENDDFEIDMGDDDDFEIDMGNDDDFEIDMGNDDDFEINNDTEASLNNYKEESISIKKPTLKKPSIEMDKDSSGGYQAPIENKISYNPSIEKSIYNEPIENYKQPVYENSSYNDNGQQNRQNNDYNENEPSNNRYDSNERDGGYRSPVLGISNNNPMTSEQLYEEPPKMEYDNIEDNSRSGFIGKLFGKNNKKGGQSSFSKGFGGNSQNRNIGNRIITFIGAKNGVGTSQIAFNTAIQLANSGYKTIYVDLEELGSGIDNIFDLAYKDKGIDSAITDLNLKNHNSVSAAIPTKDRILNAEKQSGAKSPLLKTYQRLPSNLGYLFFSGEYSRKKLLGETDNPDFRGFKDLCIHLTLKEKYEIVIINGGADTSNPLTEVSLNYSAKVFVVSTQDSATILPHISSQLRLLCEKRIISNGTLYYILNKFENGLNSQSKIKNNILSQMEYCGIDNTITDLYITTIPNEYREFLVASEKGFPILWETKSKDIIKAFQDIEKNIIN